MLVGILLFQIFQIGRSDVLPVMRFVKFKAVCRVRSGDEIEAA